MAKALKTIGTIAGAVALVATGVGLALGPTAGPCIGKSIGGNIHEIVLEWQNLQRRVIGSAQDLASHGRTRVKKAR